MDLKGKIAIVTGSSKGIGKAIILELARCGAKVVVSGRNLERINQVQNEAEKIGVEAIAVAADVSNLEESSNLINKTLEKWSHMSISWDELIFTIFFYSAYHAIHFAGFARCKEKYFASSFPVTNIM